MYVGLTTPIIAELDVAAGTYSNGFKCGAAVETNVDPKYAEAEWEGDNVVVGKRKKFQKADITLKVTTLPIQAAKSLFGHTVDVTGKKITYGEADIAPYVGFGFVTEITDDDSVTTYEANWLPKVQFSEGGNQLKTSGTALTLSNPQLTGTALADSTRKWKDVEVFATETLAIAWITGKANIIEG